MRLLYFLLILQNWSLIWTEFSNFCTRNNLNSNTEIQCHDVPPESELKQLGYSNITHQSINCTQSNKTVSLSKKFISSFSRLIHFHLGNCLVSELPENFFENLVQLQSVDLDNIPITRFNANLFQNSSNLIDLRLSRLKELRDLHPRFLGYQNQLEILVLLESNINPVQLRTVLIPIYHTLKFLHWNRNRRKISLPEDYFKPFTFERLSLNYNGIDNIDFLRSLSTEILSLKGNPLWNQNFDWKNYQTLIKTLTSLDLSETGIDSVFQNIQPGVILPKLTELILRDNNIEDLPYQIERFLPSLRELDIRNNKLSSLPSLDYMIRIKFGTVYVKGNLFHCNCEMKWVMSFKKTQIRDMDCDFTNNTALQPLINYRIFQSRMICTAPTVKLELYEESRNADYSIIFSNDTIKMYQLNMYPEEVINLQCIGKGDPAPKMKWINNKKTVKKEEPPINKFEMITTISNLILEHWTLKNSSDFNTYTCRAKNIAGTAQVILKVSKNYGQRRMKDTPVLGKIYQTDKNSVQNICFVSIKINLVMISIVRFLI